MEICLNMNLQVKKLSKLGKFNNYGVPETTVLQLHWYLMDKSTKKNFCEV